MIKAALNLLECDNSESAKALLRAFSGDSAIVWTNDGLDLAEIRPDVGQNSSEVVEELEPWPCVANKFLLRSGISFLSTSKLVVVYSTRARRVKV